MTTLTVEQAWQAVHRVEDPEIPVVDVVDMGIVRDIQLVGTRLTVTITPTYSGCPAMEMIERNIAETLKEDGFEDVVVKSIIAPAWTTDWMSEKGKNALREYGIAPPKPTCSATRSPMEEPDMHNTCPFCGSDQTELRSIFGSTACKALHFCNACTQPFESFKCI